MDIEALVFDFDGVILETEEPDFLAWRQIWADFGQELRLEEWAACIGTAQGPDTFHPFEELVARTGLDLDQAELRARKNDMARRHLDAAELVEGIVEWVEEARRLGLGLAIASSSPRHWIENHLVRLGLEQWWPVIACYDDCGVTKPDPASYLLACRRLGVDPKRAMAVEDSRMGLLAAKAAGLTCVAVPTAMTAHLDFSEADLVVPSLSALTLSDAIARLASASREGSV
ncbi:MAG TPA: HAD-IA family hydrolase [Acidimicrobiales bacterium]|nr:HAD-IA family hydrolase [Acidimicrobiales bacterium]